VHGSFHLRELSMVHLDDLSEFMADLHILPHVP
jgi:hypothetical protein